MNQLKLIITQICVLILLSSSITTATSVSSFEVLPTPNEKAFLLTANIAGEGTITIKIISKEGEKVFYKKLNTTTSFQQKYSLKDFKKGTYFLKIEDESKVMTQPFIIISKEIEVDAALKTFVFKPRLKFNSDNYSFAVNWLKSDESNYVMSIKDENSNEFFEDVLKNERIIHRNYDFSQLPNGIYYITIKDGIYTYYKIVEVK